MELIHDSAKCIWMSKVSWFGRLLFDVNFPNKKSSINLFVAHSFRYLNDILLMKVKLSHSFRYLKNIFIMKIKLSHSFRYLINILIMKTKLLIYLSNGICTFFVSEPDFEFSKCWCNVAKWNQIYKPYVIVKIPYNTSCKQILLSACVLRFYMFFFFNFCRSVLLFCLHTG